MDPALWRRAEALFGEIADLPAERRAARLDQACGDDNALRDLVETLLEGDRLEDRVAPALERAAADVGVDQESVWLGRAVGAYTLTGKIAAGGMGVVYRGRRSDASYDQEVAVKLLTSSLVTGELRRRLLVERQILANLNHPNICRLLDGGETDEGVPFLVMELIEGEPITEWCDHQGLGVRERVALGRQVCEAVQFAHRNLVVHRDIKPGNILVTADGVPKLLDFGIAKLLDPVADSGHTTVAGFRMLSPRYASPEQVLGGAVTTASDTYSLGLLLFEMLCGSDPFGRDESSETGGRMPMPDFEHPARPTRRLAQRDDAESIARRRDATVAGLARSLKGDLETILAKALRNEPERRYQTARELADELDRYLDARPVLARPPTAGYLVSRFWRRHKGASIAAAVAVFAMLAGTTAATVGFIQARESERVAAAEARNAEAISGFLLSLFEESDPEVSVGEPRSVRELLDIGMERADRELAASPLALASVKETMSEVYKSLSEFDVAQRLNEEAYALVLEHTPDDSDAQVRLMGDIGDLARIREDLTEARRWLEQARDLHLASGGPETRALASVLNNLALVLESEGEHDAALALMKESLAVRQRLFVAPNDQISVSLHNIGWLLSRNGDLDEAERYLREAIAMREAVWGEFHPRVALTTVILSRVQKAKGDWEAAERSAHRALEINRAVFEPGHRDIPLALFELAAVKEGVGELAAANELYRETLALDIEANGPRSFDAAYSMKTYARTLVDLGRPDEAIPLFEEALSIFRESGRNTLRPAYDTTTHLGRALTLAGQPNVALEYLSEAPDESIVSYVKGRMFAERGLALSAAELALGRDDAALSYADSVLAAEEALAPEERNRLGEALQARARLAIGRGEADMAEALLARAAEDFATRGATIDWRSALVELDRSRIACFEGDALRAEALAGGAWPVLREAFGDDSPRLAQLEHCAHRSAGR